MRFLYLTLAMLSAFSFSGVSNAATYQWYNATYKSEVYSTASAACASLGTPYPSWPNTSISRHSRYRSDTELECQIKGQPSGSNIILTIFYRSGDSCTTGKVWDTVSGSCITPVNPCSSKAGQPTTWKKVWPSYAASSTLGEKVNNSGCSATIVTSGCGTNGATGEFACWGTATYDGAQGVDSSGPSSACGATDPNCAAPEPLTSTNTQQCTPNADGTTTCVTESGSTEFASGECHVGSTGGATGLVCVKPDYVPEAATNKRTDVIKTEATADGGTKTTTTSTSENKHCVAGVCTNTTTTTTTTTTKDGAGKVTSETSACTGAKCDKPTDETEPEDEGMGEAKFAGKGGCEGSDCDVDAFNPFGTDVVPGYSDSLNAALSGIKRSPIGSAVSNIRWPTGGSCPVYSMQLFNSSISITEHCTVWESVGSALSAVFLAIWAFAAVRVFLSA